MVHEMRRISWEDKKSNCWLRLELAKPSNIESSNKSRDKLRFQSQEDTEKKWQFEKKSSK